MSYAGVARNEIEREQALNIAANSFFLPELSHHEGFLRKAFFLRSHPGFTNVSPIVICNHVGKVVGSAFLIDCKIRLKCGLHLEGAFISSVSIKDGERGRGLSNLLMDASINSARDRDLSILLVIARRAVDGYYNRFGFWGLSQYSNVTLEPASWPLNKRFSQPLRLVPASAEDLIHCIALHVESYKYLVGSCLRNLEMWHYILRKLPYFKIRFDMIYIGGESVGYVIYDGKGNVYEIAISGQSVFEPRAIFEACAEGIDRVTLHVHPTHPFLEKLDGLDVSLTLRECPYGGHMARILKPTLFPEYDARGIDHLSTPLSLSETCRLLSLARVTSKDANKNAGLHGSFNIPLMDQI